MTTIVDQSQLDKAGESDLDKPQLLALYEQMMLIRRFELTAQDVYRKGEMPGFIHLYVGEEATAVGVCANLRRDDWVTSTHRGHGHALGQGRLGSRSFGGVVRQGRGLLRRTRRQHAPL